MPLYRTVSDRGLWKKYQRDQVQHFHKPHYVQNGSDRPQVSETLRGNSLLKSMLKSSPKMALISLEGEKKISVLKTHNIS